MDSNGELQRLGSETVSAPGRLQAERLAENVQRTKQIEVRNEVPFRSTQKAFLVGMEFRSVEIP